MRLLLQSWSENQLRYIRTCPPASGTANVKGRLGLEFAGVSRAVLFTRLVRAVIARTPRDATSSSASSSPASQMAREKSMANYT